MGWLERRELHRDAETWQNDAIDLLNAPGINDRLGELSHELRKIIETAKIITIDSAGQQGVKLPDMSDAMALIPYSESDDKHMTVRYWRNNSPLMKDIPRHVFRGLAGATNYSGRYDDGTGMSFVVLPRIDAFPDKFDRGGCMLHESTHGLQALQRTGRHFPEQKALRAETKTFREAQAYTVTYEALDVVYDGVMSQVASDNFDQIKHQFLDSNVENLELTVDNDEVIEWFEEEPSRGATLEAVIAAKVYGFDYSQPNLPRRELVNHYLMNGFINLGEYS